MEPAPGGGSARIVWWTLAALALARAALAFVPSMWAWGLDAQRFLPPLVAWVSWILIALALHRAIAPRVADSLERAGDRWLRGGRRWIVGLSAGLLVWSLPDRTWMTGDFLIREMAPASGGDIISFAEALPIEALLYRDLPRFLVGFSPVDPNVATRTIGALAASGLAVAALAIAAAWELRGGAAVVAAASVFFGGYLCAFTGLGKPAALIGLLTAAAFLGGTRLAKEGRGGGLLGAAVGIALLTHRSALALIPLWGAAVVSAFHG
ncbi:MAG: hypothetical protein ACRENJ_12700, partial [Candidatus Eiseniibacteriota bacterium]